MNNKLPPDAIRRHLPMPTVPEEGNAMSLIDDIKRDLENGTPGPWRVDGDSDVTGPLGVIVADLLVEANARRIARLPDLERGYLDLRARAEKAEAQLTDALEACRIVDEAVAAGHESAGDLIEHLVSAVIPARAALEALMNGPMQRGPRAIDQPCPHCGKRQVVVSGAFSRCIGCGWAALAKYARPFGEVDRKP